MGRGRLILGCDDVIQRSITLALVLTAPDVSHTYLQFTYALSKNTWNLPIKYWGRPPYCLWGQRTASISKSVL